MFQLFGYSQEKKTFSSWLESIKTRSAKTSIMLISGSPGLGKTTMAIAALKDAKYQVAEFNGSDDRTRASVENIWETVCSQHLFAPPVAVLIDEIDGMTTDSVKCIADISKRILKLSRYSPIVCTCNDRYAKCLKPLLTVCTEIKLWPPKKQEFQKYIQWVSDELDIIIPHGVVSTISEMGDFRQIINFLDYISRQKSAITSQDIDNNS